MSDNNSGSNICPKTLIQEIQDLGLADSSRSHHILEQIIEDKSRLDKYTSKKSRVAVLSDGSSIGDLGNLGSLSALPVLEKKSDIIESTSDLQAVPLSINQNSISYMVDMLDNIRDSFGIVNLESIDDEKTIELKKLLADKKIPVFDDENNGLAIVILAIIMEGLRSTDRELSDVKIVIDGTSPKALLVVDLLIAAGVKNIIMTDEKGIITPKDDSLKTRVRIIAGTINSDLIEGELKDGLVGADVYINMNLKSQFTRKYIETMIDPIIIDYSHRDLERYQLLHMYTDAYILATYRPDMDNFVTSLAVLSGVLEGMLATGTRVISTDIMLGVAEVVAKYIKDSDVTGVTINPLDINLHQRIKEYFVEYKMRDSRI